MIYFDIYWEYDHYELYIDGKYIDDFNDYQDAYQVGMENGAVKRPRPTPIDDSEAPF